MEKYIPKSFRQMIAMVLCLAMILPMIPVNARAAEVVETTQTPTEVLAEILAATPMTSVSSGISIPAYVGGTTSQTMEYDCGNGVSNDGSKSYLTIVTGTTSDEFAAYKQLLAKCGYVLKTEKEIASDDASAPNLFASYVSYDGSYKLYTYHFPHYGETRIIVDTQDDTVEGFIYTPQSGETVEPMLAMYGLSMATNGYDTQLTSTNYGEGRRNCGALVVIRMPDNSLFIHDGGDIQQWSDNACDEFLAFCRELTGTAEGEKMVINTWFLSHAHSDHFLGFPRFINKYHDQFDLKNIMYNIDIERTYTTRDIHDIMQLVSNHYPNVRYYKPHTGENFAIAGVQFDVMYAHEDRYLPGADGNLITDYPEIEDGKTTTEYDLGGTYRGYCYDTAGDATTQSDFNDTSTVLRVTFENGVSSILYADMNRVEQTLFDIYPDEALVGDIVMVPHHGFDSHPKLMAMSDATIFLYTQHKQAIYGLNNDYTDAEDESIVRPKLRKNFAPMKEAIDATGAVEGTDYKFYWAGNETVVIDINSMSGVAAAADTASEMPGMTVDTEAPQGITVYTADANTDVYSNAWTVYDLEDGTAAVSDSNENLISVGDQATVTGKETASNYIRFLPVTGAPTVGAAYLIRSSAYPKYVMSYSAVAETPGTVNAATSLTQDQTNPITSTATDNFFENSDGNIYLSHSNRDNVLWIFEQNNLADGKSFETHENNYFGGTRYRRVRLLKGTSADDAYWYAVEGNDTTDPITQYRFMNPRYIAWWIRNESIAVDDEYRNYYALEEITSGVYLIYYRASAADYRILACDENGNWRTVRYTDATDDDYPSVSQITTDLDTLTVKLYSYELQEKYTKKVDFSGNNVFNVEPGTTADEIFDYIQQKIVVRDNARRNLAIPGNGGTPKVGYYWLDFGDATYDPNKAATYTVTVQYRNDDGSDTDITTLTVNVAGISVAGTTSYTVLEGTSQDEVEAMIKNAITVTKTLGSQQSTVSYSSGAVSGKYWLDFNVPFDSTDGSNLYTVSVKYRNPGGSDAVADTTLTVQVLPLKLSFTGATEYVVEEGVSESEVRTLIADSITVTRNTVSGGTETVSYAAAATAGSYWLEFDGAFNSASDGDHDYFVKVWYRSADGSDTLVETLTVNVEQEITDWTAPVDKVGTVPLNAGPTTVTQKVEGETSHNITFTVNGETRYATVGLLTDANGNRVNTSKAGTYENLTLTYMDQVICKDFTLIVTESNEALDYPQKGQGGYVGVDKVSPTTNDQFKDTGVAEIQLSATGTPPEQGIDLIVIMDLSGSMLNEMGTNVDAEDYKDSRAVAMENALKDMVQMLAESGQDVTIAMSDFGDLDHNVFEGSVADESILHEAVFDINNDNGRYLSSSNENKEYEFTNQLNYVFRSGEALEDDANGRDYSRIGTFANVHTKFNMAHPEYTGVIVPNVYTGSGEAEADAFVDVSELYDGGFTDTWNSIITQIDENAHSAIGTNYDIGLEYAYQLAYAKQQENIANGQGKERDIVCIFMSDGAAMQYNYFSGRSDNQSWSDYLLGDLDSIGSVGFSEENQATLEEISGRMLTGLQNGKLYRWEYHRDAPKPDLYANEGDTEFSAENYEDSEYFIYRMRSDKGRTSGSFYGYMEDLGFDLDWEYLCAIARANGIEDFDLEYYQSNPLLPELTEKLLARDTLLGYEKVEGEDASGNPTVTWYKVYQTDLINPGLDEIQYYPVPATEPTGDTNTEKFLNAMASIGVDCTWDIYGKIAFKNKGMDISGAKDTYEIDHALKKLAAALKDVGNNEPVTFSPYSYFYNKDGKNWWAEAIKGETDQLYPVINKYAFEDCTTEPFTYYGDVRNNYSTGTGLALDGQDYIAGFRGLDVDMYTISFSICNDVFLTVDTAEKVLRNIASGPSYFFSANTEDELTECMKAIVGSMSTAATRAWFTDTLGEQYDLYVGQPEMTYTKGEAISTIEFYEYDVDANGDRIGDPTGREVITIADMDGDGDADAWSNRMFNTEVDKNGNVSYEYYDIWDETTDLITGKYVIYNASKTKTTPLTLDDSGLTYPLPPETFFWTIGVIGESEVVLDYQVYLEGSKEGTIEIPAGQSAVYDTNEEAVLHYINYLGNNCTQDTVPPAFPWGKPAVGYVFYLVDQNGTPLDNQGRTTDFEHSLKLSTAVYENLNQTATINASEKLAANAQLDADYMLYYPSASYTVVYDQSWTNNGGATTYVTQYGGAAYSNAADSTAAGMTSETLDLEKTVVYFALMKLPEPETDSGLTVNKTVEATEDANEFLLTLEAYATGQEITITRPADIVLVLDHSGSMRTPVGAPEVLESGTLYTGEGAMTYDKLDETLGQHTGYYVAQSQSSKTWFVVRYDEASTKWFIYSVPTTESIVNLEGWTEHTQTQSWTVADIDSGNASAFTALKFYKSQYAVLYDTMLEFVQDLKDTGTDHNVAIVGFAAGADSDGTRLYVGSEGTNNGGYKTYTSQLYHTNTTQDRRDELYRLAMKNVQDTTEYAQLLSNIELIETNHSFTCPTAGLQLANEIFAANEVDLADRDRIVVLFTDGIPNCKLGEAKIPDNADADTNRQSDIYNEIVQKAYESKSTYSAQIYSISTTTLGAGADRTFLSYTSSDYPNATSYTTPGTAISTSKYTNEISSAAALGNVFAQITQSTESTSVELDETAILREVLSDYFDLDNVDGREIKVYTAAYDGTGDYSDKTNFGTWKEFPGATVTITSTDGRETTIDVTGFDYQSEYLSPKGRTVNGETYYGSKLIVQVPIRTRDGFWGGNNVPTNKYSTAVYTPADGTIPEKPVEYFPMPEANVPINVTVDAVDKTIYHNGSLDSDTDGQEFDELLNKVTIGGKDVTVNNDGTFTPQESWMDDFANAAWNPDSTQPDSDLSSTNPGDYTYTVTVTPNSDGTTNKSENPSNIAGNVDGGTVDPDHLTESPENATDTGHVFIKVPQVTFEDSTTNFGTSTDGYDYTSNDYVSTEWVFMEDTKDTTNAPAASGTAPELTLSYTPNKDDVQDGSFVTDTKVDVTVSANGSDITGITNFVWQDDCTSTEHTPSMNIGEHKGAESSNEFWVHVTLDINPDTVVIDFGLDVVIDVLANDPQTASVKPSLSGIGAANATSFGTGEISGTFGKLTVDGSNIRYALNTSNGMQMNREEVFKYQATYTVGNKSTALSDTVTVIPATTIYYEDTFVDFTVFDMNGKVIKQDWDDDGTQTDADQAQDRPGAYSFPDVDANNIYGYDGAYTNMATHSLNSAKKVTANSSQFAEAQFTFQGTGFDVVSLTSNTSGTVTVSIYRTSEFVGENGNNYAATPVETHMVDTYYGYQYVLREVTYEWDVTPDHPNGHWVRISVEAPAAGATAENTEFPANPKDGDRFTRVENTWVVDPGTENALYQIPVMKVSGLEYGQYTALITVWYEPSLDHQNHGQYDFYLDAIRIYDPANDGEGNQVIEDAYVADGEGWPEYFELRNLIIKTETFDSLGDESVNGIVFIDNTRENGTGYSIEDYTNFGPNNELYLAPGQSVAFNLSVTDPALAQIHLAMKSVGVTAHVKYYDAGSKTAANVPAKEIATATDLYYDITDLNKKTVVITNSGESGDAILSITNVKVTYTAAHDDSIENSYFTTTQTVANDAVKSLMRMSAPEVSESAAVNETTGVTYTTLTEALNAAQEGDTIKLLQDQEAGQIMVYSGVTLDLNGFELTADYVVAFDGADIIDSVGSGKLIVSAQNVVLDEANGMIPVHDGEGYLFTKAGFSIKQDTAYEGSGIKINALAYPVNMDVVNLLKDGASDNNLQVVIELTWETDQGTGSQQFVFTDEVVARVYSSNQGQWNKYSNMFSMVITGIENVRNLNTGIMLVSDTDVSIGSMMNP